MDLEFIGHWLFTGDNVTEGYLRVESGAVEEICMGRAPAKSSKCIVLPGFVNAHVHVGDSVAYPAPKGTVEELVAPPDGYKHRVLRTSSGPDKVRGIRESLRTMSRSGTTNFIDFREEGLVGIRTLLGSVESDSPEAVILGRPAAPDASDLEIDSILSECQGIGMSALRDWPPELLGRLSRRAKQQKKLFALHVSESVREDFDSVLDLRPDFVVHMTKASEDDLRDCAAQGIPVVLCPRSNEFYGLRPDIGAILRHGLTVALGTDNCMISRPDMFEELRAAYRIGNRDGTISPLDVVRLACVGGRKLLNPKGNMDSEISSQSDFVAVRVGGSDPLRELVTSSCSEDVEVVVRRGTVRRFAP